MARKKKNNDLPSYEENDDFSYLDNLDDDLLSTGNDVPLSYEDDDVDIDEDYLGVNKKSKKLSSKSKKEGGKGKWIGLGVVVAALLGTGVAMQTGSLDEFLESDTGQTTEEQTSDNEDENNGDKGNTEGKVNKEGEGNSPEFEDTGVVINEKVNETYSGNDNASSQNGTGAILAFAYQMYTERNGEKARQYYNPDAHGYSGEMIQKEIDTTIPEGTQYTMDITPLQLGSQYEAVLKLTVPNFSQAVSYNLNIETMERDGRYFIKTFTYNSEQQK